MVASKKTIDLAIPINSQYPLLWIWPVPIIYHNIVPESFQANNPRFNENPLPKNWKEMGISGTEILID